MRTTAVLLCSVLLLTSLGAAAEGFGSYLYPGGEQASGEQAAFLLNAETTFQVRDGTVYMQPSLTLNLTHDNYTEANVTKLRAVFYRGDTVLANRSIGRTVIPQYKTRTVTGEIQVPPLNTVDRMEIVVGFYAAPEDRPRESIVVWRQASSSYGFQQFVTDQQIGNVSSNASSAYRGSEIFIQGVADNVDRLNASGTVMEVSDGSFQGWVNVPSGLSTGNHTLTVPMLTDAGNLYRRSVPLRIRNNPPTFTTDYPAKIATGDSLTVRVNASDDRSVQEIKLTFQDETYTNSSGIFTLPTETLGKQTYSFRVTVTDDEDKTALASRSFEIVSKQEEKQYERNNGKDSEQDNDDDGGEQKQQRSSIPIIGAFQDMIRNFLLSLLGAN